MGSPGLSPSPVIHIVGSSVIGPLHTQINLPCQDACAFQSLSCGTAVIAIADGLGSAKKSDVGAQLAVSVAVDAASLLLKDGSGSPIQLIDVAVVAVNRAREALVERAAAEACQVRDLACTMIMIVMTKDDIAVAHIGDGAVVAQTQTGLELVSDPGESEYANEVIPLTSEDWEKSLRRVSLRRSIVGVAALTDGCQRAAFRKADSKLEPFEGFFKPIFEYVTELPDFAEAVQEISALLSSKKCCANSDDDKTLVIAVTRK